MTLQIDSLDVSADETPTRELNSDELHEQVVALDARILDAIERRTELMRTLTATTGEEPVSTETSTFADLGSDGSVISRMLARLVSAGR